MWIDPHFPPALDAFLAGRPWTGPLPDGDFLLAATADPGRLGGILQLHAARQLAACELEPAGRLEIGGDILLPIAAVAQLQQASFGPQGLAELAQACARLAAERGLPRNLAEDALCAIAFTRLPPFPAAGSEETRALLGRLTPWSSLHGDLRDLTQEQAEKIGAWLAERVLPAARRGRYPLRKLLLQKLVAACEVFPPLPYLAALAPIVAGIARHSAGDVRLTAHLADFFECYCGWLEGFGPCDSHLRDVARGLEIRDPEAPRRREAVAAAAFFGVLAHLDPAAARNAPRLHSELLQGSRGLARRLEG